MKFFTLFLLLILLSSTLFAQNSQRLIITKTSNKSHLKSINTKLTKLKIKMYIKKSGNSYIVYSQTYNTDSLAKSALWKVKPHFRYARIVKNEAQKTDSHVKTQKENKKVAKESKLFISLAVGINGIQGSSTDESVSMSETSGFSYGADVGYKFNKNIFISLGYRDTSTSDIAVNNLYGSLNYRFNPLDELGLFLGLLGGYSSLELSSFASSTPSTSLLFGAQMGVIYDISQSFAIFGLYQGMILDHKVEIDSNTQADFNLIHNTQIGLQYKF